MRVSINLPDRGTDPLVKQLSTQFAQLQKTLSKQKAAPDGMAGLWKTLSRQQDSLVRAMERLVDRLGTGVSKNDDALLAALRGMKKALSGLPGDLKAALETAYKAKQASLQRPHVTVKPEVKVSLNGFGKRFDRMEEALASASKRSRNRTFGSNY